MEILSIYFGSGAEFLEILEFPKLLEFLDLSEFLEYLAFLGSDSRRPVLGRTALSLVDGFHRSSGGVRHMFRGFGFIWVGPAKVGVGVDKILAGSTTWWAGPTWGGGHSLGDQFNFDNQSALGPTLRMPARHASKRRAMCGASWLEGRRRGVSSSLGFAKGTVACKQSFDHAAGRATLLAVAGTQQYLGACWRPTKYGKRCPNDSE